MFCTFCGVENPEYAKFCRKCGAQINLVPAARTAEFTTKVEPGVFPAANTPVHVELPQPQMERALAIETVHDYAGHYKNLTTDELVRLEAEKGSLTAEASSALEGEFAARGWPQPSILAEHATIRGQTELAPLFDTRNGASSVCPHISPYFAHISPRDQGSGHACFKMLSSMNDRLTPGIFEVRSAIEQ